MSKKQIFFIIVVSVLTAWVFSVFPGRLIVAKISTWPLLNRWKILSPQAPIVINNRETVRVSDSGDVLVTVDQIKPKLSTLVSVDQLNNLSVMGSAVNLSSDGTFVTASGNFSAKTGAAYFVVLNDGRQAQVSQKTADPATSLTFFKAALDNVPVAGLASSKDLGPGEKLVFAQASLKDFSAKITSGFISSSQNDVQGQVFQSDAQSRSFGVSVNVPLVGGEIAADSAAYIAGIWNGTRFISSDVLKQAADLYFSSPQKISRPSFGFSYLIITTNESKLSGLSEGAKVLDVAAQSPAQAAGLLPGDLISELNSQPVNENSLLEELLGKFQAGDKINLSVIRKGQPLALSLTAGELAK